ncbi:GAF domain-containing protein [Desulfovibrio sulfodismutans]|uniref:GAF domain-containing protein n=1 Tax=Desulfolutivibrio sulfodismutans TaxID=63561 RepID=A0A7K3NPH3_9BACT|nr:GAF domain-containing protein [Desulfolutivibrio sulfodismutans]QLA14523.1 GAF domain-containing protein [Desulfolutivibrio sulfodismutans DSM 3696]
MSRILELFSSLRELTSLDAILERILSEARELSGAEAGTVFLREGDRLGFSYVQNDRLSGVENLTERVYQSASLPIDGSSIAGYAALTGQTVTIEDAWAIPEGAPYHFNIDFDKRSGYRTRSILSLPVVNSRGKVVAVMQLINAAGPHGRPGPFTPEAADYAALLTHHAAAAIETGLMTREMVLRMVRMAELRDPSETGPHAQRVGAYAAEIYHALALARGAGSGVLKRTKDLLSVAAMLHDVGKVGIPDGILQKPGPLTPGERAIMCRHTWHGAALFRDPASELDVMAADIAAHHHQRFDGAGYPACKGPLLPQEYLDQPDQPDGSLAPLAGQDIPLAARIVGLADVYDALISRRVYKQAWPDDQARAHIARESGGHFDPEVVRAFFSLGGVVTAIRERFPDP